MQINVIYILPSRHRFFYAKFSREPNTFNANHTNGNVANGKNDGGNRKTQEEVIAINSHKCTSVFE